MEHLAPRPLLPVAQRPLITYVLRWMEEGGLEGATICANSEARAIRARLGGNLGRLPLDYHEDWTPRGAAGCVRDAGLRTKARTFVVADGTTVPVVDFEELLKFHYARKAVLTVVVGADEAGRMRPGGIYVFEREALAFIPEEGFQDIKERLIPRLYEDQQEVATFLAPELVPRVLNAETYLDLNRWALERAARQQSLEYRPRGEATVHGSATVAPTARLLGPILLGPRVQVGEDATIIGPVSIGAGTVIASNAVVSRSVVWDGCVVSHGAFVDRSMLADRVVVRRHEVVFSVVKVGAANAERSQRKVPWAPLVEALWPTTAH